MKKLKICSLAILLVLLVGCAVLLLSCDSTPADPCANGHTEAVDAGVAATCTAKGLSDGKHCSVCNKVLVAQTVTDKIAHTASDWKITVAATCESKGSQYRECTACKTILETQIVEALTHDYGEPAVTKQATCTQDGAQTVTCARCDDVKTEKIAALSHVKGAWTPDPARPATCSQTGVETRACTRCSATLEIRSVAKIAHDFKEEINIATVCGTTGSITRTCKRDGCFHTETEPLETVACTLGTPEVIVAATCEKDGVQQAACTVCGKLTVEKITALGHNLGELVTVPATCKAEGAQKRVCQNPGCTEEESTPLPIVGHTTGTTVLVAATCEQGGAKTTTCAVCGKITVEELSALGHSFTSWSVSEQPSCSTTGLQVRTCTNPSCEKEEHELLPCTAHDYTDWVTDFDPTCSTPGRKHRDCLVCEKTVEVLSIEQTPHAYPDTWTVLSEPSCSVMGRKERTCPTCNFTEKVGIPTTDHAPGDWTTVLAATETSDGSRTRSCTVCSNVITLEIIPATGGPVQLTYTINNDKATVTGYTDRAEQTLRIPETLGGYPVVSIAAGAFVNATRFTTIKLPTSLISIEAGAFTGCTALVTANGVSTLDGWLISVDPTLYTVTIPTMVKKIANGAFAECYKLVQITNLSDATLTGLPANKGQEIRKDTAFQNTISTSGDFVTFKVGTTVYLLGYTGNAATLDLTNKGFTAIYDYALANNAKLTILTIPVSITNIGDNAFSGCKIEKLTATIDATNHVPTTHLRSLTVTGSPVDIPSNFLSGCATLETAVFPSSILVARKMALVGCTNLKYLTCPADMLSQSFCANLSQLITLTINGGTVIDSHLFNGNNTLKSVSIAASVTTIKGQAFHTATALETVTFASGSKLETLSANAFSSTALKSINLPTGLKTIGSQCFMSCSNLTSVTIPSTVTTLDEEVFHGCSSLQEITIPASVESIGSRTANNIVRGVFGNCTSLKKVTFAAGSKLKTLPTYAFYGCKSLTSITIPASVTSIGFRAFEASGVTSITFGNTSGWKVYKLTNFSSQVTRHEFKNLGTGTAISVTSPSTNVTNFKTTYAQYFWVRG